MRHFVIITGGVCSSLGKGICAASLGRALVDRELTISMVKLDPYLNGDPGTMAPGEHGECWVTADGTECDLDLGHYERFTGVPTNATNSITAGNIYWNVLTAERRGDYLGGTVQAVPHITGRIVDHLRTNADNVDVVIAEIGGTVGDIEIQVFLEAVRQLEQDFDDTRVANIHLTLVPEVGPGREPKTKPSQHSVTALRSFGLTPDILVARSAQGLDNHLRTKLARTCGVRHVIDAPDVDSVYDVVEHLCNEQLDTATLDVLDINTPPRNSTTWTDAVARISTTWDTTVRIGIAGKYIDGHDTYLSVTEALKAAAGHVGVNLDICWIDTETIEQTGLDEHAATNNVDGIVVPGGFGTRGVEGMVNVAGWARTTRTPYLGLCLGLQVAVIEWARNVAGIERATSAEWGGTGPHIIALVDGQAGKEGTGATMRLGNQPARITGGTRTAAAYDVDDNATVVERHRHRYEVNPAFVERLTASGLTIAGVGVDNNLVEYVEIGDHPWFVATQAHPEFTSRPGNPNPLFVGLIEAARDHQR